VRTDSQALNAPELNEKPPALDAQSLVAEHKRRRRAALSASSATVPILLNFSKVYPPCPPLPLATQVTAVLPYTCHLELLLRAMFTGIIEHPAPIPRLDLPPSGGKLIVHAPTLSGNLAVSASIAVNGCCLTVVHHDADHFSADLSPETVAKTSFAQLKPGARV